MDWVQIAKYAASAAGTLAAVSAVPIFFWTNFSERARRLAIMDLAIKRITFWNQFLNSINLATVEGSPQRKMEQAKALQAIQRIHTDALLQIEALVQNKKIARDAKHGMFRLERHRMRKWYHVLAWWYLTILAWLVVVIGFCLFVVLEYQLVWRHVGIPISVIVLVTAIIFTYFLMARVFFVEAEKIKYERLEPPIIDAI